MMNTKIFDGNMKDGMTRCDLGIYKNKLITNKDMYQDTRIETNYYLMQ